MGPIPGISASSEGLASLIEPWLVKPELKSALALTLPMASISKEWTITFEVDMPTDWSDDMREEWAVD